MILFIKNKKLLFKKKQQQKFSLSLRFHNEINVIEINVAM